jgi:hypothetical protein
LTLEDVIEEMAGKGWDDIKDLMDLQHMHAPLKDYKGFQNAVYRAVMPFVRSYRLCGNFPICTEPIRGAGDESDEIYHLFLNGNDGTDEFFERIAQETTESIDRLLKPERRGQVVERLRSVFEEVLMDYLCTNPLCGESEVCKISELSPVQPWFRVVRTGEKASTDFSY